MFLLSDKLNSEYNKLDICYFNKINKGFNIVHQDTITTNYGYVIERYNFDLQNKNKDYILKI